MAASKGQRIGIWIIAVFMAIGTVGSFAIIVLANDNASRDQNRLNELMAEYQKESTAYQEKVDEQAKGLSEKYYDTFNQYADRPAAFDAAGVTELQKTDLVAGDGEELTADSTFTAYYLGWNPSGTIFDGSIADGALKAPLQVVPGSVIKGWGEGVVGMKVNGIRELAIPAELAYGETGSGENIPPNTPIKFVVMIIPNQEVITQPQPSEELLKLYSRVNGSGQ